MSQTLPIERPRTRPRETFTETLTNYLYVLYALVLHDIKSRFFGSGLGQIVMVMWPFVHILVLLAVYTLVAKPVPYGTSLVLYSCTGILPFIIFSYMSRWIVYSAVVNRSFLQYPIIKPLDIMISRAILETVNSFVVTLTLIALVAGLGVDPMPADALGAACAYGATMFLALGMGILNGAISSLFPLWNVVYTLIIVVSYISSGILFVTSDLPERLRDILGWNPLLQCIDWMRSSYYIDYPTLVLDRGYVLRFSLICLFLGLVLEKLLRRFAQS